MNNTILNQVVTDEFHTFTIDDCPSMRLSGDGMLSPLILQRNHLVQCAEELFDDNPFCRNQFLRSWSDRLVFFNIRRVTRMRKVIEKLGLREPTYHHAVALALRARSMPVTGTVVIGHPPLGTANLALSRLSVFREGNDVKLIKVGAAHVFTKPVWAVGVK